MSVSSSIRSTISPDIGIDLGTANTVIYDRDAGIIVSEPSVVAFQRSDRSVVAVGNAAKVLDGRLRGEQKTEHIDIKYLVELLFGDILDRRELVDTGVINQDV